MLYFNRLLLLIHCKFWPITTNKAPYYLSFTMIIKQKKDSKKKSEIHSSHASNYAVIRIGMTYPFFYYL